jgi:hypothetical protein
MFHVSADETDVHAVNVIDDEHDHEQRQDVAFHFRDGGREVESTPSLIPETEVSHLFSPTDYFYAGWAGVLRC